MGIRPKRTPSPRQSESLYLNHCISVIVGKYELMMASIYSITVHAIFSPSKSIVLIELGPAVWIYEDVYVYSVSPLSISLVVEKSTT